MDFKRQQSIGGILGIVPGALAGVHVAKKLMLKRRPDYSTIKPQLEDIASKSEDLHKTKAHIGNVISTDEMFAYYKSLPEDVQNKMTIDDYEKMGIDLMRHKLSPLVKKAGVNDSFAKNVGIGAIKGSLLGLGVSTLYNGVFVSGDKYKDYTSSAQKRLNEVSDGFKKVLDGKPDRTSLYSLLGNYESHSEQLKNPAKLFPGISLLTRTFSDDYFKRHGVDPGKLSIKDYHTILKGIDRHATNSNYRIDSLDNIHPIQLIENQRDYEKGQTSLVNKGMNLYGEYPNKNTIIDALRKSEDIMDANKKADRQ